MSPPNPKRPPRPPRPEGDTASRQDTEVELPFDDDEVAPLQADDPRPQRVPQFPALQRRLSKRGGAGGAREGRSDRELPARFDTGEYEDPGHMAMFLYVEQGPGAGQLVPLKQGTLVLGRSSSCDLRLQHPSISRRHAQLTRQGDRLVLRDLGSQNGTFLNRGRLYGEAELSHGDQISLGNAVLRLRAPGLSAGLGSAEGLPTSSELPHKRSLRKWLLLGGATALAALLAALLLLR